MSQEIHKIAFLADFVPRRCGIATFTNDLRGAVAEVCPQSDCFVVPVNDLPEGYDYPPEVRFEIAEQDLSSYRRAADFLNCSNADVVCLQHEFGIYGGPSGSHVLALLRDLRMPAVATLHTVLKEPSAEQRRVMRQLAHLCARVVVMSERGQSFLQDIYGVPEAKIDVIPHGIPDMPFIDPAFFKDQFGVEGKFVLLTFGLLSPNKGIENMLRALPALVKEMPNVMYIVLGATHPNLLREQGESYRLGLERLAKELGVQKHVVFYNRFVELKELTEFIGAADIYITPYLNPAQITSGTLAYSFGCGKAVVSTPYWHAEELLAEERGVLVPFNDSAALAREIMALIKDETRRHAMRKKAYLMGRDMVWNQVAQRYLESFERARRTRSDAPLPRVLIRTLEEQQGELPDLRLDHVRRMTDSTGLFQHACFSIPNFTEGYCTDDNARGLLLTMLLDQLGMEEPAVLELTTTYAAFLQNALHPQTRRFRNFMSFDRRWLEEVGSEDSHGRALWALGACVGRCSRRPFQMWAAQTFDRALPVTLEFQSPRSLAFTLLGIHEYGRRLSGDRRAAQIRDALTARLLDQFAQNSREDWPWLEDKLAYDNPRSVQALILSGWTAHNDQALDIGLQGLRWLMDLQRAPGGYFRPIGSAGFYPRGGQPAQFDQQPVEVWAAVSACHTAYRATGEESWLREARTAFEWFQGRNDLGLEMYDPLTAGCRDGLQQDRTNQNQGAESTLSFLLALAEMKLLDESLAAFRPASAAEAVEYI